MIRRLSNLAREESGAVLIELAMVAPVLAMMVIGIADISTAYGRKLELEQAAQRAMEKVMQTTGEKTPEDTIKAEAVCQYNGVDKDGKCEESDRITVDNVTVEYSLTCNGTVTDYNLDCAPGQTEVRYITMTVTDNYEPMFPLRFGTMSDGKYHLSASAGMRVA